MTTGALQLTAPPGITNGTIITTPSGAAYKVSPGTTIGVLSSDAPYLLAKGFIAAPPILSGSPIFLVTGAAATSPVLGTTLKIPFSTVVVDTNNNWNATNSQWVPNVAGWYRVFSSVGFTVTAGAIGAQFITQILKNDVLVFRDVKTMQSAAAFTNNTLCVSGILYLNGTTDTLSAGGFFSNNVAITGSTFSTNAATIFMGANFLGP